MQAGLGLASAVHWAESRFARLPARRAFTERALIGVMAAAAALVSFLVWNGPALAALRQASRHQLAAAHLVARSHGLCGVGLYDPRGDAWARYGGYTYLHQPAPVYWTRNGAELGRIAASSDVLLYRAEPGSAPFRLPAGFRKWTCFGDVCVARRPGSCAPAPMTALALPGPLMRFARGR